MRFFWMPRYFFHLFNGEVSRDDEGKELSDQSAAHEKALSYARDMAAVTVRDGYLNLTHRIEVTDQDGDLVVNMPFGDAVRIDG